MSDRFGKRWLPDASKKRKFHENICGVQNFTGSYDYRGFNYSLSTTTNIGRSSDVQAIKETLICTLPQGKQSTTHSCMYSSA